MEAVTVTGGGGGGGWPETVLRAGAGEAMVRWFGNGLGGLAQMPLVRRVNIVLRKITASK
ncbi:hypothetical protein Kpho01_01260 [Kitasatospora phosalacinea]|uniref:Uncharacterized protein n=1 Tax=Kitasatospora phosalacinea TaxID=2065 RepID=A0A9W6PAH7_9ACTN|nr:hypothetical protein Kpho01_01260 [Kitasatospora phosalacinea]